MRTSLNNIQLAEGYLQKQLPADEALLFEANMILDAGLRQNVAAQQSAYSLVQQYGRKQLKMEIEAAHRQLFNSPKHLSFTQKIWNLFR